jgi:hypothetical protein
MESNQPFQKLSDALNDQINQKLKDKKIMKRLLITASNNSISKIKNMELLAMLMSFVCSLYFISRTIYFTDRPFLLWTGIVASVLWLALLFSSWIGFNKLSSIKAGEDSIIMSIEKITFLIRHYNSLKKINLWFIPLLICMELPIPLFEFRKFEIAALNGWQPTLYILVTVLICIAAGIFAANKMWEATYKVPLEDAKQNLKELLD